MIPNKSNFKFQELTPITGVKPYVLRFWETEFPEIAPVTSDSGHKLYAKKDIELIFKIKKLLFEDKMSIPEARSFIQSEVITLDEQIIEEEKVSKENAREMILKALDFIQELKVRRNW